MFEYGSKRVKTVQKRLHATRERKRKLSMIKEKQPQLTLDSDDDLNAFEDDDKKNDSEENDSAYSEDADECKFTRVCAHSYLHICIF